MSVGALSYDKTKKYSYPKGKEGVTEKPVNRVGLKFNF